MSCTEVQKWLNDYVDGELSDEVRPFVEEHLRTCLSCNRALSELQGLLEQAHRLAAEVDPEKDLWQGIASRIVTPPLAAAGHEHQRRQSLQELFRWRSLAAAALLLLAIAVPLTLWQLNRSAGQNPSVAQSTEPGASASRTTAGTTTAMLARSEDGVLLPRTDLLESLERQRGILSLETLTTIEENAELIDQAIAQVRTAMEESPGDRQLELLLATRYKQEVALLKRVNQV